HETLGEVIITLKRVLPGLGSMLQNNVVGQSRCCIRPLRYCRCWLHDMSAGRARQKLLSTERRSRIYNLNEWGDLNIEIRQVRASNRTALSNVRWHSV